MDDPIDSMLQGTDDPAHASQAQNGGQGSDSIDGIQPLEQQSPEEVEFNKLSGNAQERFRKAFERINAVETENSQLKQRVPVPPAPLNFQNPDQQNAIKTLEDAGISTDRKVDQKLDEKINGVLWKFEQDRLESKYDGSRGEPQYVREEVEDFYKTHPQYAGYSAEDVYKFKMFPDEFMNLEVQNRGTKPDGSRTKTLRPTKAAVQDNAMTVEYIQDHLDTTKHSPDEVRKFYDDHLDEINSAVSRMAPVQQ